jgi:hypothetical protein
MYKIYDYHNRAYLSTNGVPYGQQGATDKVLEVPDQKAAEDFLYNYGDNDHHRFDVQSRLDARDTGVPIQNAYAIHEDSLHDDIKNIFENYYEAKIEVSFDIGNGHTVVLKDEEHDRYGVALIDMDTQEVYSKGGFMDKDQAMDYADDLKSHEFKDIEYETPDFTLEETIEERTFHEIER